MRVLSITVCLYLFFQMVPNFLEKDFVFSVLKISGTFTSLIKSNDEWPDVCVTTVQMHYLVTGPLRWVVDVRSKIHVGLTIPSVSGVCLPVVIVEHCSVYSTWSPPPYQPMSAGRIPLWSYLLRHMTLCYMLPCLESCCHYLLNKIWQLFLLYSLLSGLPYLPHLETCHCVSFRVHQF